MPEQRICAAQGGAELSRITASYEIESPQGLAKAAETVAGEQSTGTFVRLASETDAMRARFGARIEAVEILGRTDGPSLPSRGASVPCERGRVTISWPMDNIGPSLTNLMATIAGNLFEMAGVSAIRLVDLQVPEAFAAANPGPAHGISGTRALMGVPTGPMIGTIVKPSVGLSVEESAKLAGDLAHAGLDFIKDDELQSNGPGNRLDERIPRVMAQLDKQADKTGRRVMYAFNITGEIDEMARNIDLLERHGAGCAMVSLNWVGLTGLRFLRDRTGLPIHGHRNGWGLFSRSPHIGISYPVMQMIWRMAGADHLHVNGLANKFTEPDAVVIEAARAVQRPLPGSARCALPVVSSGQTVWQIGPMAQRLGNQDFLMCAGGGILAHPDGAAAGVAAFRQAGEAARLGVPVQDFARDHDELAKAIQAYKQPRFDPLAP